MISWSVLTSWLDRFLASESIAWGHTQMEHGSPLLYDNSCPLGVTDTNWAQFAPLNSKAKQSLCVVCMHCTCKDYTFVGQFFRVVVSFLLSKLTT